MLQRASQGAPRRGAVAVYVAVAMPVLIAVVALAIDAGLLFDTKRSGQAAADATALAAAAELFKTYTNDPGNDDGKDVAGTAVWFRTTVDDYGEVWVDGKIDLGYGRGAIAGFNTPNEVMLTKDAKPGQTIQIAVLAMNSPWGNPPGNWIFFRDPTVLRFYRQAAKSEK